MGLLEDCQALFGTLGLYEVLGVSQTASEAHLRRGYYQKSLKVHPDRAPGDPLATAKFQTLGKVYAVLTDAQQRALYDQQGTVVEDPESSTDDGGGGREWSQYWRALFPQITVQDIVDFEGTYVGSAEERTDLLRLYGECRGDMDRIAEGALCGSHEDEPRIRGLLQEAVDRGELPALRAFTHESGKKKARRKRNAKREAEECERMTKEMKLREEGEGDLSAVVRSKAASREAAFSSMISSLEVKYGHKKPATAAKKKSSKKHQFKFKSNNNFEENV